MKIPFWKMHGAGNDFILFDDRDETFPVGDRDGMARLAARRTGVGCDGIILIQPSASADFRMRFFNPDGREAEMCGNGARCVARLAHELEITPAQLSIETMAGNVGAEVLPDKQVRLAMPNPSGWKLEASLELPDGRLVRYDSVNSGVPHTVVQVDDLAGLDVAGLGRTVREHAAFAPAGTNVNFVMAESTHSLRIRTYERGVEAETLACGTGVTASALVMARRGIVEPPVTVRTVRGYALEVDFDFSRGRVRDVALTGPAEHVCEGLLNYN